MTNTTPKYSKEEIARRGEEIFGQQIAPQLQNESPEKFVLIDIDSGDFEVHSDELTASDRLRQRRPNAQVWMRRVGSAIARRYGNKTVQRSHD